MNQEITDESSRELARGYCDVLQACRCEEIKVEQRDLLSSLTGVIRFSFL